MIEKLKQFYKEDEWEKIETDAHEKIKQMISAAETNNVMLAAHNALLKKGMTEDEAENKLTELLLMTSFHGEVNKMNADQVNTLFFNSLIHIIKEGLEEN